MFLSLFLKSAGLEKTRNGLPVDYIAILYMYQCEFICLTLVHIDILFSSQINIFNPLSSKEVFFQ